MTGGRKGPKKRNGRLKNAGRNPWETVRAEQKVKGDCNSSATKGLEGAADNTKKKQKTKNSVKGEGDVGKKKETDPN